MPGWDQDRWVFVFDNSIESCISLSKASASRFSACGDFGSEPVSTTT